MRHGSASVEKFTVHDSPSVSEGGSQIPCNVINLAISYSNCVAGKEASTRVMLPTACRK